MSNIQEQFSEVHIYINGIIDNSLGLEIVKSLAPNCLLQSIKPQIYMHNVHGDWPSHIVYYAMANLKQHGITLTETNCLTENGSAFGKKIYVVYIKDDKKKTVQSSKNQLKEGIIKPKKNYFKKISGWILIIMGFFGFLSVLTGKHPSPIWGSIFYLIFAICGLLLIGVKFKKSYSKLSGKAIDTKVDDLIFRLKDVDAAMRESYTLQMIALGEPAVKPLINYLKHPDKWARLMAAAALGKIGDTAAVEPLQQALTDSDEGVRYMAQTAFNELNQKSLEADKSKKISDWTLKQPRCSECKRTSNMVEEDKKRANPKIFVVGNLVGICPTCRKAFCTDHATYDYGVDGIICPTHKKELDIYWDNPPSEDKPWRIGGKPL